jgi:hypothetical protein
MPIGTSKLAASAKRKASAIVMPVPDDAPKPRRFVGYCHQRTNARHRHQPPADRLVTNDREHRLVQLVVFRLQRRPRRKHCRGDVLQRGVARHQPPNPSLKSLAGHRPDLRAKAPQNRPDAQFHIDKPRQSKRPVLQQTMAPGTAGQRLQKRAAAGHLPMTISRMSPGGARRLSCSRRIARAGYQVPSICLHIRPPSGEMYACKAAKS